MGIWVTEEREIEPLLDVKLFLVRNLANLILKVLDAMLKVLKIDSNYYNLLGPAVSLSSVQNPYSH